MKKKTLATLLGASISTGLAGEAVNSTYQTLTGRENLVSRNTARAATIVNDKGDVVANAANFGGVSQDYMGFVTLDGQPMTGNILVAAYSPTEGILGAMNNNKAAFWLPENMIGGYIYQEDSSWVGLSLGEILSDIDQGGVIVVRNPTEAYFGTVDNEQWNIPTANIADTWFLGADAVNMSAYIGSGLGSFNVYVPEPATLGLLAVGGLGIAARKKRK